VDFGSGEGIAGRNVCKAHERMHQGELPRVIELEARNALSRRRDCRFCELSQLTAIDKGLPRPLAKPGRILHRSGESLRTERLAHHRQVGAILRAARGDNHLEAAPDALPLVPLVVRQLALRPNLTPLTIERLRLSPVRSRSSLELGNGRQQGR
jgi:hypothetical protein